ncbi:DNA repair helicase rad25 [Phellopilus nigrolimitatus]|nr:DNA repair helicase rad25 [Phellopilus nigrolimitatus]
MATKRGFQVAVINFSTLRRNVTDERLAFETEQDTTSRPRRGVLAHDAQLCAGQIGFIRLPGPGLQDFSWLYLKPDHASRMLEPVRRPAFIHEYNIARYSLYAAVSVDLQTEDIIEVPNRISKTKVPVPDAIVDYIRSCTMSFGKVKLVLKHNKYFIESSHPETLQTLLKDAVIPPTKAGLVIPGTKEAGAGGQIPGVVNGKKQTDADLFTSVVGLDNGMSDCFFLMLILTSVFDEIDEDDDNVHAFEVDDTKIDEVKKRCNELEYPMLEEYDFRNDTINANIDIDLKPATVIRPYQETNLSKMFRNGRARSGIIVLPCGVGKTLVVITAACMTKTSFLVLAISCIHYRLEREVRGRQRHRCVDVLDGCKTYNRPYESKKMMEFLQGREWGFILLDEVHVVPVAMFRRVVTIIKAYFTLGSTVTLVRNDHIAKVQQGDKIIVYSGNVYALEHCARKLGKLYIHGGTSQVERMRVLQHFQHHPKVNTIILFKVGDTTIDLLEATCLIQISSLFGSRKQEAQCLGRILCSQRRNDEGFNSFFYSLQKFRLINRGCTFKVVAHLKAMLDFAYRTRDEQIELISAVLLANESDAEVGGDLRVGEGGLPGMVTAKDFGGPGQRDGGVPAAKRMTGLQVPKPRDGRAVPIPRWYGDRSKPQIVITLGYLISHDIPD